MPKIRVKTQDLTKPILQNFSYFRLCWIIICTSINGILGILEIPIPSNPKSMMLYFVRWETWRYAMEHCPQHFVCRWLERIKLVATFLELSLIWICFWWMKSVATIHAFCSKLTRGGTFCVGVDRYWLCLGWKWRGWWSLFLRLQIANHVLDGIHFDRCSWQMRIIRLLKVSSCFFTYRLICRFSFFNPLSWMS